MEVKEYIKEYISANAEVELLTTVLFKFISYFLFTLTITFVCIYIFIFGVSLFNWVTVPTFYMVAGFMTMVKFSTALAFIIFILSVLPFNIGNILLKPLDKYSERKV